MEELKILVEGGEEEESSIPYVDIEYLLDLKITLRSFLKVNNFDVSKEPDFREMTDSAFIKYYEKNVNSEVLDKFSDLNIRETLRSNMSDIYQNKEKGSKIFVFFLPTSEQKAGVGIDVIKNFCKLIVLLGCNEGLLISEKELTSKSKEMLDSSNVKSFYGGDDIYNVISYVDNTFINVLDHCLAPQVLKIYTGEEVRKFSKDNNLNVRELPRIFNTDPIVKFYRGRVGDVIKFKRRTGSDSTLANEQIVFRLVTHGGLGKKK